MEKNDKVQWVDGIGFEHTGVVVRDTDRNEFMIPVRDNRSGNLLTVAYRELRLVKETETE